MRVGTYNVARPAWYDRAPNVTQGTLLGSNVAPHTSANIISFTNSSTTLAMVQSVAYNGYIWTAPTAASGYIMMLILSNGTSIWRKQVYGTTVGSGIFFDAPNMPFFISKGQDIQFQDTNTFADGTYAYFAAYHAVKFDA